MSSIEPLLQGNRPGAHSRWTGSLAAGLTMHGLSWVTPAPRGRLAAPPTVSAFPIGRLSFKLKCSALRHTADRYVTGGVIKASFEEISCRQWLDTCYCMLQRSVLDRYIAQTRQRSRTRPLPTSAMTTARVGWAGFAATITYEIERQAKTIPRCETAGL